VVQATFAQATLDKLKLHGLREGLTPANIVRRATLLWLEAHPLRPAPKPLQLNFFSDAPEENPQ